MVAGQVPDDHSKPDLNAVWQATRDRLRASVPESTFRLWLEPLEVVGAEGETLYLSAPEGVRTWAERRYSTLIGEALADSGTDLRRVSFAAAPAGGAERIGEGEYSAVRNKSPANRE